jgi:hypothetical protein
LVSGGVGASAAVAGSKIVLEWRDPLLVGRPPFHSYALLRRSTPTQTWTTVTLGGEMDAYEDADVQHKQVPEREAVRTCSTSRYPRERPLGRAAQAGTRERGR